MCLVNTHGLQLHCQDAGGSLQCGGLHVRNCGHDQCCHCGEAHAPHCHGPPCGATHSRWHQEIGPTFPSRVSVWLRYDLFCFQYKTHTPLNADKIHNELLECCSKKLQAQLYRMSGKELDTINEVDLLAKMKELVVQKVHEIVHWQEFYQIKQDEGEPFAKFVTRLKSKATLCNYHMVLAEAKGQGYKVS